VKAVRLAVLGSTGSIGRQTLDVIRSLPGRFNVIALAAGTNITLLEEQVREFRPRFVCAGREADYLMARGSSDGLSIRWAEMEEMAGHPDVDLVIVATAGSAGLGPTLAALRAGKSVALANKEVLVMAGHIITAEARRSRVVLRPIDSEHSAIWQCLWGENHDSIERIVITASGGPFRDTPPHELSRVTAEEALRHGIASRVVPRAELDDEARKVATTIAAMSLKPVGSSMCSSKTSTYCFTGRASFIPWSSSATDP